MCSLPIQLIRRYLQVRAHLPSQLALTYPLLIHPFPRLIRLIFLPLKSLLCLIYLWPQPHAHRHHPSMSPIPPCGTPWPQRHRIAHQRILHTSRRFATRCKSFTTICPSILIPIFRTSAFGNKVVIPDRLGVQGNVPSSVTIMLSLYLSQDN